MYVHVYQKPPKWRSRRRPFVDQIRLLTSRVLVFVLLSERRYGSEKGVDDYVLEVTILDYFTENEAVNQDLELIVALFKHFQGLSAEDSAVV
jgi:hypothetical protein